MTAENTSLELMTCEGGRALAAGVAEVLGCSLVPTNEVWFACGEGKMEIGKNIRGSDVFVFQSAIGDAPSEPTKRSVYDRFTMLLHAIEAASLSDAASVTAVVPYYPGSRQDKRKGPTREGITAGLFARAMQAAGANRVLTVEIHNEAISGMFDPRFCRLENLFLTRHFSQWLAKTKLMGQVVVAPDVGGLERARRYAAVLSADLAALSKERDYTSPNAVLRSSLIGEVADRDVLLVDDIVDTGGSVVAAVEELKSRGARDITTAAVHPLLSAPAMERLQGLADRAALEGWRFAMVGTSSVRHEGLPSWYSSMDLEPLLAKAVERIHTRGSVRALQD